MRVVIAGSRTITDYFEVKQAILLSGFVITEVISGDARGVDKLGETWAKENKIPVQIFPADWLRYGRAAGFRRNRQMAFYSDALIAVWDGSSRGTGDMIRQMEKLKKPFYVHRVPGGPASLRPGNPLPLPGERLGAKNHENPF